MRIVGTSMHPTYRDGERVLVFKRISFRFLKHGDIVISDFRRVPGLRQPNPTITIKRVIGLPGDVFDPSEVENLHLVINIDVVKEGKVFCVPPEHYLVGADSSSSPFRWGPIPSQALLGIVVFRLGNSTTAN